VGQIPLVCIRGAYDYLESPNGLEECKVLILDKLAYCESCNEYQLLNQAMLEAEQWVSIRLETEA
jgi:hypothetical protein